MTKDSTPTQTKNKLELVYIDVGSLELLEGNPRQLKDPQGLKKLKTLIKEHGFSNPLQIWRGGSSGKYTILCGNHRFVAGTELGMTSFPCFIYEGSKGRALARALSDNKSSEWTEWDITPLSDVLINVKADEVRLPELTGFDPEELGNLIDNVEAAGKYKRPDFTELIEQLDGERGKTDKNRNWFYVEFYGDDKMFGELRELVKEHLVRSSPHELDPKWFANMVKEACKDNG